MINIHGKMLVKNFRQMLFESYGLRVRVNQGLSRGQFADDEATLAATRSAQLTDPSGEILLHPEMTVNQAEAAIAAAAGFAVQVLTETGELAPNDAPLGALGFPPDVSPVTGELPRAVVRHAAGSEVSVTGQKRLATIQGEFTARFPQLGLMFFSLAEFEKSQDGLHIRPLNPEQTVASVRTKAAKGDMSIHGNTVVAKLEQAFRDDYGLYVQVCFMKEGKPVYTVGRADGVSISELNRRAEAQGRGGFVYPKW